MKWFGVHLKNSEYFISSSVTRKKNVVTIFTSTAFYFYGCQKDLDSQMNKAMKIADRDC